MAREIELINHLPEVYKEPEEMREIMRIETPYINALWSNTEQIYTDSFILTSGEYGLNRRFEFLGMPILAQDDIETKRFKLLARYREQAPYTRRSVRALLDSLLGEGNYILDISPSEKTFDIQLRLTQRGQFDAVVELLERVVPQNMVVNTGIRYNIWEQVRSLTWSQVKTRTWNEIKEGAI